MLTRKKLTITFFTFPTGQFQQFESAIGMSTLNNEFSLIQKLAEDQMLRVDATAFADYLLKNKLRIVLRSNSEQEQESKEEPKTKEQPSHTIWAVGFEGELLQVSGKDSFLFQCCQCNRWTIAAYYPPCSNCRSLRCYHCANDSNKKSCCKKKQVSVYPQLNNFDKQ